MKMRPLPNGIEIKPGETVEFKPGSYHLMFVGLKQPFEKGKRVKGTLQFEKAGTGRCRIRGRGGRRHAGPRRDGSRRHEDGPLTARTVSSQLRPAAQTLPLWFLRPRGRSVKRTPRAPLSAGRRFSASGAAFYGFANNPELTDGLPTQPRRRGIRPPERTTREGNAMLKRNCDGRRRGPDRHVEPLRPGRSRTSAGARRRSAPPATRRWSAWPIS